jgi:hypothetical protein
MDNIYYKVTRDRDFYSQIQDLSPVFLAGNKKAFEENVNQLPKKFEKSFNKMTEFLNPIVWKYGELKTIKTVNPGLYKWLGKLSGDDRVYDLCSYIVLSGQVEEFLLMKMRVNSKLFSPGNRPELRLMIL